MPDIIMVVVKQNLKPVTTTITIALNTELSKAVWQARDAGRDPIIQWSIAAQTALYKPGARSCNLCLTEKLAILQADSATILNKRSELNSKCRDKNKFKLKNFNI